MRTIALALVGAALASLACAEDWIAFGQGAAVQKSGETISLQYKIAPGQLGMAVLPMADGKLAGMTHLQFRLRTDASTVVAVMLSEKKPGGGDYTAAFWSPKDQWQQIDLTPADFAVNDGPKDPKDPDGRLDLDQVQHIAVLDLGQFFSQVDSPMITKRLTGEHKFDVEALHVVAEAGKPDTHGIVIDDFHRGFLGWFTPGGGDLALSKSGNALGKPALEFRYEQTPGKLAVVMHALGQTSLRDAKELAFDVTSTRDAHLIVVLEGQKVDGRPGPRYNLDFIVTAGQVGHMSMPFSEFTLADDSPPDPEGHLNLSKVRMINLADVTGILTGESGANTVWIADMRAQ